MKKKILILGGGRSTEHEVSLISAYNILQNIPRDIYEPILAGIDKNGGWQYCEDLIVNVDDISRVCINPEAKKIDREAFIYSQKIEIIFPILLGSFGEDGCMQGFLETLDVAYVGSNVKSSSICMDKVFTKDVLERSGIKTTPYRTFFSDEEIPSFSEVSKDVGSEKLIVKTPSLGSSIGVYLCEDEVSYQEAVQKILAMDTKILIEKQMTGREIETAILGNEELEMPVIGEVKLHNHNFYSYEAKYIDLKGAELIAPADLSPEMVAKIENFCKKAYKAVHCSGMARVDCFLQDDELYINEINTLPGFTQLSTYPKLWQVSGMKYSTLIDRLIQLALERKASVKKSEADFSKLL